MVEINAIGADPLAVTSGGTGAETLTGILVGNGTSAVTGTVTPTGITSLTATSLITSSATLGTTYSANTITSTGSDTNIDLSLVPKGSGGVLHSRGIVGGDVTIEATNTDNTNGASRGGLEVAVGGASAGDPYVNFLVSGAGVYTMGIDNSASDNFVLSASAALGTSDIMSITSAGAVVHAGAITSTAGAITATNGNLVLNTAGNKIVSTSVAASGTAGANSFGTVTLSGGTITVSTTAVTASSIIFLTRMSVGATGANDLGILSVGTISAGTSFVINAWTVTNATALQTDDVSVIGWMLIN